MLRILTLTSILLAVFAVDSLAQNVLIPTDTVLSVTNIKAIDSTALKVGDDLNFTLSSELAIGKTKFPAGTEILGLVLENEQDSKTGSAHVVVMFNFIKFTTTKEDKTEEHFYLMKALIEASVENIEGLRIVKSDDFDGGTILSMKGKDLNVAAGTAFKIRLLGDVTDA